MIFKKAKDNLTNLLEICRWVLTLVYRLRPKLMVLVVVSQILISALPFGRNWLFSRVIDQILNSVVSGTDVWIQPFIIFVIASLFVSAAFYFQSYLGQMVNDYLFNDLRTVYIDKISSLDYQRFENKETANLIAKTNEEYRWRTQQVVRDINSTLANLISLVVIGVIVIPHYWYLAILLVISQIPNVRLQYLLVKRDWEFYNSQTESLRQGWDVNWQLTDKKYLAEIKINQSKGFLLNKISSIWNNFTEGMIDIRRKGMPFSIINMVVSIGTISICLLVLVGDIRRGILTIGLFTFYFQTINQISDIFSGLVSNFISVSQQSLYVSNFRTVMEMDSLIKSGDKVITATKPAKIEFRDVYFRYPGTKRWVLNDFSLTIDGGEEIALVGANGAGKSTIIKLILRYYDPDKGQILLNGVDIREYKIEDWYENLSFLSQEFNTYRNLDLKENVLIGKPQLKSEKKVLDSLKKADAMGFVNKYENGIKTMMSQSYGGEEPSWGQWQKIAIARVFYRNTPIIILDEPTASIDAVSEAKIFDNIYEKEVGKTLIIVSHRFSTVRKAQRIIVVDQGKIVEQGSHEQLIKIGGKYAHSFNLQAKGYN